MDRPLLHKDGSGFSYQGTSYTSFTDRAYLPSSVRRQTARWAVKRGTASDLQQRLAQLPLNDQVRAGMQAVADHEDHLLHTAAFADILDHLQRDIRVRVLRPAAFLPNTTWPLRPIDVHTLFPHISTKQLRDWDAQGLVKAYRFGPGQYRGYFRSQLVAILLVDELLRSGWGMPYVQAILGLSPESVKSLRAGRILASLAAARSDFSLTL